MIFPLFRRGAQHHFDPVWHDRGAGATAVFLPRIGVPYTVDGRFELTVLHLALVLERLALEPALQTLGQGLLDRFFRGMPKEMQRIGEALYGHAQALRAALAAHDPRELVDVLRRNVYGWNPGDAASRLAAYVREAARALAALDGVRVARGQLRFPDPLTIPAAAD